MLQRWHEITFFHWSCDPSLLQRRIPPSMRIDTFEGKGWISLSPFFLKGLRPPLFPESLGMSFPEMNLRTYVVGPRGPGIWFFSLDAARLSAVAGARMTTGLPYFWADMRAEVGPDRVENSYYSNRGGKATARIRIKKGDTIVAQSELDLFLTNRLRLYSILRASLLTMEVEHPPWMLKKSQVLEFDETVRRTMGVEFPGGDFLVHHSPGVDTKIGRPQFVSTTSSV
jgi:uncharacterized protein YqjF (DUF2071 family)